MSKRGLVYLGVLKEILMIKDTGKFVYGKESGLFIREKF